MRTIQAYQRKDGRIGIRNYVIVLSLVQCANRTAEKIAAACGVPAITINTGCGEYKKSAERTDLGLIRAGQHPNVYGALLVSLGCQWIDPAHIAGEILKTDTAVHHICIQEEGGLKPAVEKGIELVKKMQTEAAASQRRACDMNKLVLSTNAGGSDWTSGLSANPVVGKVADKVIENGGSVVAGVIRGLPGAEKYVVERAANPKVGAEIYDAIRSYCDDVFALTGQLISEVDPTPGNKEGGLTTLTEKAIGNAMFRGNAPIQGLIHTGDAVPYPGNWFLTERQGGNDIYQDTACAMCGAHLMLFTTGRGSPQGHAVMPIVKVTGNADTARRLGGDIIDYSAADVLAGRITHAEAADALFEMLVDVCNGTPTKAEIFGDYSYATPPAGKY